MRRLIPYFAVFLGIVAISKVMTLIKDETTIVEMTKTNAADVNKVDEAKIKSKVQVLDQKGDLLFNIYNIDTSQIERVTTCNKLYDLSFSPEEVKILQTLRSRNEKLNEIEKDINTKNDILITIQNDIDKKLEQLEKMNSQMTDDTSFLSSQNYGKLVKIYEGMKPKEAAKIFDTLQTQVLLGVAQQMKENKLAAIVAEMTPDKARDLTMGLANTKNR